MNKIRFSGFVLMLALAMGCGGGGDGPSATTPTIPPAPPPPPPEPPGKPTGIRLTDRGPDFVEWSWDPVEDVTSYEAHLGLRETPPDERTLVRTDEPSYRWEGLPPLAMVVAFVRAVRETPGGRAVGEWSDAGHAITLPALTPVAACSNERRHALRYEAGTFLVEAWDPEQPFRVWIDEESIRRGGEQFDRPEFLEEEVLEPLRDVADRIEERLGYRIFDPDDLLPRRPSTREPVIKVLTQPDRQQDPPWSAACAPATISPMNASPSTGEIFYNEPFFDPLITCQGYVEDRTDETIIHELGHNLGMRHHPSAGDPDSRFRGGVVMSEPLTFHKGYDDSDVFVLPEDIDAIGCIFPHPDHPR